MNFHKTQNKPAKTKRCSQILEKQGWFTYSDAIKSPTRLMVTVDPQDLLGHYPWKKIWGFVTDPITWMYEGLTLEHGVISISRIAKSLDTDSSRIGFCLRFFIRKVWLIISQVRIPWNSDAFGSTDGQRFCWMKMPIRRLRTVHQKIDGNANVFLAPIADSKCCWNILEKSFCVWSMRYMPWQPGNWIFRWW